jgi:hypothetical protein
MREIIVKFCIDDTEQDVHPQLIVEDLLLVEGILPPDTPGFDILADTARVDESIPERLTNSKVTKHSDRLRAENALLRQQLESWRGTFCECQEPGDSYDDCHVHGGGDRNLYKSFPASPYRLRKMVEDLQIENAALRVLTNSEE